jgi:hypothetical protein
MIPQASSSRPIRPTTRHAAAPAACGLALGGCEFGQAHARAGPAVNSDPGSVARYGSAPRFMWMARGDVARGLARPAPCAARRLHDDHASPQPRPHNVMNVSRWPLNCVSLNSDSDSPRRRRPRPACATATVPVATAHRCLVKESAHQRRADMPRVKK